MRVFGAHIDHDSHYKALFKVIIFSPNVYINDFHKYQQPQTTTL